MPPTDHNAPAPASPRTTGGQTTPISPTSSAPQPLTFDPDPSTRARLLEDLLNPLLTINDVATYNGLSAHQLNLFIASSPELAQAHHAAAIRLRLLAASQLPDAVAALAVMLGDYRADSDRNRAPTPEHRAALAHHARETRRAAHLLYRLANYNPNQITSPLPSHREGPGVDSPSPSDSATPCSPTQSSGMGILPVSTPSTSPDSPPPPTLAPPVRQSTQHPSHARIESAARTAAPARPIADASHTARPAPRTG